MASASTAPTQPSRGRVTRANSSRLLPLRRPALQRQHERFDQRIQHEISRRVGHERNPLLRAVHGGYSSPPNLFERGGVMRRVEIDGDGLTLEEIVRVAEEP